jgi:hypothetical protein
LEGGNFRVDEGEDVGCGHDETQYHVFRFFLGSISWQFELE